jgi:AraC-like DNA-binding protein
MILFDVPMPDAPRLGLDLVCREMESSNLIALTGGGPSESPSTQGTLSIKCTFGGAEVYQVDGRSARVSDATYLILNQGQRYSSFVDEGRDVESLCIFFRPGFAEEALGGMTTPDDLLLDEPPSIGIAPIGFVEKLYRHDDLLSPLLFGIRSTLGRTQPESGWIEEQFHLMMERMLQVHRNVLAEIARLPAIRRSTRVELYRRLSRARDYIESCYCDPLTLVSVAREARLSTYHFLRLFRRVYGTTPFQYITRLRLDRAAHLLATTDDTVSGICFDLGFESPTSFSLLFRKHFDRSPTEYRRSSRTRN